MRTIKGKDTVESMHGKMQLALLPFEGFAPHLAIIRVGENDADISYEKGACTRMGKVGIRCSTYQFPADISMEEFTEAFEFINNDEDVDGILLFRPLPKQLDEKKICMMIDPVKDVDCISPVNLAKLFAGEDDGYAPCTAQAVVELLENERIETEGKEIAIIGRSMVVGKPLAMMLLKKNATVTICHRKTQDIKRVCQRADILVACAGSAKMVDHSFLKNDAIVIDVGINMLDGKLCGDVDFDDIADTAEAATPVPGGVGAVTTSVLAKHVIEAATRRRDIEKVATRNGTEDSYLV